MLARLARRSSAGLSSTLRRRPAAANVRPQQTQQQTQQQTRGMMAGPGLKHPLTAETKLHVSPIHDGLSKGYLLLMWVWIMYRIKQDGGVTLGLDHPYLHHAHKPAPQFHYVQGDLDSGPTLVEDGEEDEEEEEDEE